MSLLQKFFIFLGIWSEIPSLNFSIGFCFLNVLKNHLAHAFIKLDEIPSLEGGDYVWQKNHWVNKFLQRTQVQVLFL